jgi:peptide/nickel transport system substrate-binding protein
LLLTHSALLHVDQLGETAYYFLNPHVYPFNDVRVRRAVNFGLDRRAAVAAAGGGLLGHPTCQVLPPTMTGYRPYCPYTIDPNGAGTWTAPDILRARQLVRAAGAIGAHVTIIGTRDEFIPADQVLRSDLVAIGLRASVRMVNPNAYYAFIGGTRNHVAAAITGWLVDYPAPSDMFLPLLTCSSVREANALNLGRFCDPRLDTVIHQAADEQQAEPAAAAGRWAVADRIATNDAPWVFLVNRRAVDILSSRTRNYEYQTELGVMLDQLWVR